LDGGAGNDTVFGDAGNDSIISGSGTDVLYGGADADYLVRKGGVGALGDADPTDLSVGLAGGRRSATELSQAGDMTASLQNSTTLTLAGPSGHGFKLLGSWSKISTGGADTFKAAGTIKVQTDLFTMPLLVAPTTAPLTITTSADRWDGAGTVTSMSINQGTASVGTNLLGTLFNSAFGLDVS